MYDLIVIGGGPAGYLAAERAGGEGFKTLLIEKRAVGGVCLNEGCIPSKTLLYSAKLYDHARFSEKYGVTSENASLDHSVVIKRKRKVVRKLVSGIKMQLKRSKVEIVEGEAYIDNKSSDGYVVLANGEKYTSKRLLVATGSMPVVPPIDGVKDGIEKGFVLTNREILDINEVPESLVIIGGGVIGLEMASYFNSAGSNVTVIEMLDHIAGNTDKEISQILMNHYKTKGIEFNLSSKVVEVKNGQVSYEQDGERKSVKTDKVLLSVGRRPVTRDIGLENIGVEIERGRIKVDETGLTNIPNVYAAGDVTGQCMLAHFAYRQAEVCVNNMLGNNDRVRFCAIPSVIYTNPEVASIGVTEDGAKEAGIDYKSINITMNFSGRYVAENEGGDGICKIIVDNKTRKLLGVTLIGNPASEIIYGIAPMIETEMRIDEIKQLIFPHPTVSEIIREGIFEY